MNNRIDFAHKRVIAIIEEIERLEQSEFPYSHPKDALAHLKQVFIKQKTVLEKVSPDAPLSIIGNVCSTSLYLLFIYVPILGFILRSTNVRNAFEAYSPLLRMAQTILNIHTKLIVSSEWDYSPFVYRSMVDLPGFVLIGLPAPESANPLLIPLIGHELGHSVWDTENYSKKFEKKIETQVLDILTEKRWDDYHTLNPQFKKSDLRDGDLFSRSTWISAFTWSLQQAEEIFSDFFGLRLFSESYLYAFSYIVSPGISGQRSLHYPTIANRMSYLVKAAKIMGIEVQHDFEQNLVVETEPLDPATKLMVSVSDEVSKSLLNDLIFIAQHFAEQKNISIRNTTDVSEICAEFDRVMPISRSHSVVDILNAGWNRYLDTSLWEKITHINAADRDHILKDIILKSMEVIEVYARLERQ